MTNKLFKHCFVAILSLAGIMFAASADAKVKLKNELLTYEQMTEITNSSDAGNLVYILNGRPVPLTAIKELKPEYIVYIEGYNKKKLKELYPKIAGDKAGALNVAAIIPAVHTEDEYMPTFLGGNLHVFRKWIGKNVKYPDSMKGQGISGTVYIQFTVSPDGTLTSFKTLKSPHADFTSAVVEALKCSPRWIPGIQKLKAVPVVFTIPVGF